jgi:hypothetical protein
MSDTGPPVFSASGGPTFFVRGLLNRHARVEFFGRARLVWRGFLNSFVLTRFVHANRLPLRSKTL